MTTTRRDKVRDWAAQRLGLDKIVDARVSEVRRGAYKQGFREGYDYTGDRGEDEPVSGTTARYGYRRSTTRGLRDFTQIDRETILEIVWTLWQSNPVADRSMEFKRDYILGRGLQFTADDDGLQVIIDEFVKDNELMARLKEFVLQLYLFGSQCYPVFVRKTDGRVQLGYFDPAEIEDVIPHPKNSLKMWAVVIKDNPQANEWEDSETKRVYRIVRREDGAGGLENQGLVADSSDWLEDVFDAHADDSGEAVGEPVQDDSEIMMGRYVLAAQAQLEPWEEKLLGAYGLEKYSGSCIYVKVNSVSNQPHGWSDLLQSADWLDQLDEVLFSIGDREQLAGYRSWDVTVEGATPQEIRDRANEIYNKPPGKGNVNVHGKGEIWEYVQATLGQTDSIATVESMMMHAIGGLGYPRHWYGKGDETNRATAQAQGDPTWRTLEHDQDAVRDMILWMLHLVRDQAIIAGRWSAEKAPDERTPGVQASEGRSEEIVVTMPEMTVADMNMVTNSVNTLAGALVIAQEQGWQTRAQSREMWAKVVAELGVELDLSEDVPVPEPAPFSTGGQPVGKRAANHGTALDGSGETGEPREWSELTSTERQEMLVSSMERHGIHASLDDVAEVLDAIVRKRVEVG